MTDITIPPNAMEAGKDSAFSWLRSHMEDDVRVQHMTDEELTELVSAACLAMLRAWPGVVQYPVMEIDCTPRKIVLPLSQEETDQHPRRTLDEMRGVFAEAYKSNREPRDD